VNVRKKTGKPSVPKEKKGRRFRRLTKIALWIGVAVVILRIGLSVALPLVADKVARGFAMTCSWERLDLSLLTGNIELWHLDARSAGSDDPVAAMEYCRADLDMSALLTGQIVLRRVEVDGLDVMLRRNEAGEFEIAQDPDGDAAAEEEAVDEADDPADEPGPIDFTLPVEIKALRLQHAHIFLRDESVTPVFEGRFDLNLRVSSLGSAGRQSRFELTLSEPALLDSLVLEGTGSAREKNARADLRLRIRGFRPREARALLEPLGIEPVARILTADCDLALRTAPAFPWYDAFSAHLSIDHLRLAADDREAVALDHVELVAPAVGRDPTGAGFARIARVAAHGGCAKAARYPGGALLLAGLKMGTPPDSGKEAAPRPVEIRESADRAGGSPEARPTAAWRIDEILLGNVGFRFIDEAAAPAADLEIYLEALEIRDLADDPSAPRAPCSFDIQLSAPGTVERIGLAGEALPFGPRPKIGAALSLEEITVERLRPYLDAAGIEPTFEKGSFTCRLDAGVDTKTDGCLEADLSMTEIRFTDSLTLFGLDRVGVSGVALNEFTRLVHVDEIAVTGTRCDLRRNPSGLLEAAGFRFGRPTVRTSAPSSGEPVGRPAPARDRSAHGTDSERSDEGRLIEIDRIVFNLSDVAFVDSAVTPPFETAISRSTIEVTDLVIDGRRPGVRPERAGIAGSIHVPGLAEQIELEGTLLPDLAAPSLSLTVEGAGLTAEAAAGYLEGSGLEMPWDAARFRFVLDADLGLEPGRIEGAASIRDLVFADGDEELAGADELFLRGLEAGPDGVRIAEVGVIRPRAHANRSPAGVLAVAGVRFGSRSAKNEEGRNVTDPATEAGAPAAEPERTPKTPERTPNTPLVLERFFVQDAAFNWADSGVEPAVATAALLDFELANLSIGHKRTPASFVAALRVPDSIEELTLSGSIVADPAAPGAHIEIDASGLRAGPLAAYFSEGIRPCLDEGRFSAVVDAGLEPNADGGQRARLSITGIEYADGTGEMPLVAIDAIRALVGRLDPAGGIVTVDELALEGMVCNAEKRSDGALRILGMEFAPPEKNAGADSANTEETSRAAERPSQKPSAERAPGAGPAAPRVRTLPPLVTIEKIDLAVDAFTLRDGTRPDAPLLAVNDLSIRNPEPIILLGDEPETQPPAKIAVRGSAAPALDRLAIDIEASPFAPEPDLRIAFEATGIDGRSVADLLPALADRLAGVELIDGRLGFDSTATLHMRRRQPLGFDFSKNFGLELVLENLALTNGADDAVLAGLEELRVDVARIDPLSGDVHVRSIEVVKPRGMIARKEDGLHMAGFVFRSEPEPNDDDAGAETVEPERARDPIATGETPIATGETPAGSASDEASAEPGPEIRIDRIFMSDIDFVYSDTVAEPDMTIPLVDLDVDISRFTTRAFSQPEPIRFDAYLKGGKVPLRKRTEGGNLYTAIGRTAASLAGGDEEEEQEDRPLLEEITVSGKLTLSPRLSGRIKTDISAVELSGFEGPVAGGGVTLDDGILDAGIDLLFNPDGSLDTAARFTMTDLSLSEPADGLISRYLNLPVPLDMVIFLLRDEDGAIEIPLDFHVGVEGMSTGEILSIASTTLGTLIADAVAASPFRVLSTAGDIVPVEDLLSLGGDEEEAEPLLTLGFRPGDTFVSRAMAGKLEPLVEALSDDEELVATLTHELGAGDVERAGLRADPSRADCIALVARLRQRKAEIIAQHEQVAAQARAAIAAGFDDRARTARDRLGRLERELGLTERSLDEILEFLRPGSERRAVRRMREACIAVGRLRLEAVRALLAERLAAEEVTNVAERIRVKRPRFTEPAGQDGGSVNITW